MSVSGQCHSRVHHGALPVHALKMKALDKVIGYRAAIENSQKRLRFTLEQIIPPAKPVLRVIRVRSAGLTPILPWFATSQSQSMPCKSQT